MVLDSKSNFIEEDDFLDDEEEDTLIDKYLIFSCDSKLYALDIQYVTEIVAIQPITEVPDLPPAIKGIINLRGKVFPVLDIRLRFHLPSEEYTERTCFIIAMMNGSTIGLIVDAVLQVEKISPKEIEPSPKMGETASSRFVKGIGKSGDAVKIILDLKNLIHDGEHTKFEGFVQDSKQTN